MTKEELIHITLKQLSESYRLTPENFRLEDPELGQTQGNFPGPTIIWQFRIQMKDGQIIQDPNNTCKTIIVTYNRIAKQLSCHIYFREVNSVNSAIMPESQVVIQLSEFMPYLNRTYRQFMELRGILIQARKEKDFVDYLQKLNKIFPSTHEDDLFK